MKTFIIFLALVSIGINRCASQGFVNLDFEGANLSGYGAGSVPATNAIPGWTAYIGGEFINGKFTGTLTPLTNINYNSPKGGSTNYMVDIIGTNSIQGNYFIYLQGSGIPNSISIGQTATIPATAQSLTLVGKGIDFYDTVAFNGHVLPLSVIGNMGTYSVYAANISAYAGQTGELLFTSATYPAATGDYIDNIQFSSSPLANVWLTTDNQSQKMQQQTAVAFTNGGGGTNPVVVDETQTYQQIEGFGASFTDTTGYILNEVATPASRTNAMVNLFTRNGGGIGLSFVRNPMGASDLARYMYSYDDLPAGQTDTNLNGFSIAHDQADIIPLVQQALQLNPQLKIMASPWSPPGWMRTTNSMVGVIGGPLLTGTTNMSQPFANYFVKYIQAYQAAGIPINYISLQNEPLYTTPDYPGLYMDATTQLNLLRNYVLPALTANNLTNTRVLVYDHNWDRPDYPSTVFADATVLASAQVAGTAWHGYGGTPGAMLASANKYPAKGNYMTEHSSGTWVGDQVRFDFEEITHCMRTWAKSYVKWNMAANQNYGPNTGGCNTCSPLVYVNTGTLALSYGIEFYTMGHFSKFVLPGAYRIFSGNASGIVSAAFLNPDGSKTLVAFNDTTNSQTFQVQWGNQSFSYTLASYSGATFTWTGTQAGGYAINPANQIQASSFNSVSGLETEPTTDLWGGYDVGYANTGDYAVYQNVNFAAGFTNVNARIASAGTGGTLEFRLDSTNGTLISAVTVPVTGGWQTWQTVSGVVTNATGLHNLYVVFKGGGSVGNLNWFQFGGALTPTNHPPVLAAIANQTILAGRTLLVTNSASDSDVPSQALTYGLLTAPSGAAINTNSGVFAWRPTIAQSPTTQSVAVVVSDTGVPVMSATQSFTVTVNRPVRPTLTPAPVTNGQFPLMISGDVGPDYIIQTSTNLTVWSAISTSSPAAMPYSYPQTNTTLFPFLFYRALLGP